MKKILGLLLLLVLNLAVVEAIVPKTTHPAKQKVVSAKKTSGATLAVEEPMLSFKQSDCRTIPGTPNIVVCVEGEAGAGDLDLNILRSLKGVTRNLITKYNAKAARKAVVHKASVSDCGGMPDMMNDPMGYAAWMACTAGQAMASMSVQSIDPCTIDPMSPACIAMPTADPCTVDPMSPACTGATTAADPCTVDPMSPACVGDNS